MVPQSPSTKKTEAFEHEYSGVFLREGDVHGQSINTLSPLIQTLDDRIQHAHQNFEVNMLLQPIIIENGQEIENDGY
jgi:hypothetical protein